MSYDPAADFAECDRVFPKPGPIAVPRVARSLDALRVGQWVAVQQGPKSREKWWLHELTAGDMRADWTGCNWNGGVVIVEDSPDPPPEPVQVSRAAFDRLADVTKEFTKVIEPNKGIWSEIVSAARALVDEVNKP